jgi:hypothetical protein
MGCISLSVVQASQQHDAIKDNKNLRVRFILRLICNELSAKLFFLFNFEHGFKNLCKSK